MSGLALSHLIRRIQIQTTRLAQDILGGAYRSAFKGKGIEFEEVRSYEPGDEIRSIDWKVTARRGQPYVKVFKEERELTVMLIVDVSASCYFGSREVSKKEWMAEIAALLAFSAIKNNDKIGLLLFSDKIEKYIPPANTTRHVLKVIRELLLINPQHASTNINVALKFIGKIQKKSTVCFLLSDFLCEEFEEEAKRIALKHDLIGLSILDSYDKRLPQNGIMDFRDLETLETKTVSTETASQFFQKKMEKKLIELRHLFHKIGADFLELTTDQPYLPLIQQFFKNRVRRL